MTSDVTSCEVIQWQFVCQLRIPPRLLAIQHCQRMNNVVESTCFNIQVFYFCIGLILKIWLQNTFPHCSCQCRLSYGLYKAPAIGVCGALCFSTSTIWNMTNDIWHLTSQRHNSQPWHLTSDIALFPANLTESSYRSKPHLAWNSKPPHLAWNSMPPHLTWLGTPHLAWKCALGIAIHLVLAALGPQGLSVESMIRWHISSRTFSIWAQSSFNCFRHSTPHLSAKSVTFNTFSDIFCKYHEAM